MPNRGHRWTPEEEQDALELGWPAFSARHPDISKNAYRIRRRVLQGLEKRPGRSRFRSLIHRLVCGD